MLYMDVNKTAWEKARRQVHKNAASNIEQALYGHLPPMRKTIIDEPDMQDTVGEARTSS